MTKLVNKDAELMNPCLREQEASYSCLSKNGYDQEKCEAYFENYNTCKKFWSKVSRDRRAKGIYPHMPPVNEREQIKADYMQHVKNSIDGVTQNSSR